MHSTYEEIDAECERLAAGLPPVCKPVLAAFMQLQASPAIRARCAHCGGLLKVTVLELGRQGSAPLIACPCGRSKNFISVQ